MKALIPLCAAVVTAAALAGIISFTPAEGGLKRRGADAQEELEFGKVGKVDAQKYEVDISREGFGDTRGMITRLYVKFPNAAADLVLIEGGWKHQRARLAGQSQRFAAKIQPGMKIYCELAPARPEPELMMFTPRGGLEWMNGNPAYLEWKHAKQYCEEHGARLPTIEEWIKAHKKLGEKEWGQIFFGAIYECLYTPCYWSSTEHVEGQYDSAYYFYEGNGKQYMFKYYSALTRCVQAFTPGK